MGFSNPVPDFLVLTADLDAYWAAARSKQKRLTRDQASEHIHQAVVDIVKEREGDPSLLYPSDAPVESNLETFLHRSTVCLTPNLEQSLAV